jgi:uncharacterized membrane protein
VERRQLANGISSDPEISLKRLEPFVASAKFPKPEELMEYDVLVISDVDCESLTLYPNNAHGPDRVRGIKRFVEQGGGYIHGGGTYGFHGNNGRAKIWGTPIADILPTELPIIPEGIKWSKGYKLKVVKPDHEIMRGIPWATAPYVSANYELIGPPKKGATVLATIEERGKEDPGFVIGSYGKGRVAAFAPDPAYTMDIWRWKYYTKFWVRVIRWLAKKPLK